MQNVNHMNYEKFDLQKALDGAKVITRDGREVSELYYFKSAVTGWPIVAVLDGEIDNYCMDGSYRFDKDVSNRDLFMAPVEKVEYRNLYPSEEVKLDMRYAYKSIEEAKGNKSGGAICILQITRINDKITDIKIVHHY